jgi:hypothetical protein
VRERETTTKRERERERKSSQSADPVFPCFAEFLSQSGDLVVFAVQLAAQGVLVGEERQILRLDGVTLKEEGEGEQERERKGYE